MTQPGRAAIEIVGDVSRLGAQLERDAQRAINQLDLDTSKIANEIGDGFEQGTLQGTKQLDKLHDTATEVFEDIAAAAEDAATVTTGAFEVAGEKITASVGKAQRDSKSRFVKIGEDAAEAADGVGDSFEATGKTLGRFGETLVSLGSALVGLGASAPTPAGVIAIGVALAAIVSLIGPLLAVGAALADLAGLLAIVPAALFVLGAALAAVTIGFQGFGDAIEAVIKGDPEKIAKALEKLAPAARRVVKEFQVLLPQFRSLGDVVQQNLFTPLGGILTVLARATLPTLKTGLSDVAHVFGGLLAQLGLVASSAQSIGFLNRLFQTTEDIVSRAEPSLTRLFSGILAAADALLPSVQTIGFALFDALGTFGAFLSQAARTGKLQQFFDDAVATVDKLWGLLKAVGGLLGTLFGDADDEGRDFIQTLTDLVQRLDEFFQSAQGQRTLDVLIDSVKIFGIALGAVVNTLTFFSFAFANTLTALEAAGRFFVDLGSKIGEFWGGLVSQTESAAGSIGGFFNDIGNVISGFWNDLVDTVSSAVDTVVDWFQALPSQIANFVQSIPGLVAAFFDSMIDQTIAILATGIAAIIVLFTDLPGQIVGALIALGGLIVQALDFARTKVSEFIEATVTFVSGLPTRIAEGLAAFGQLVAVTFEMVRFKVSEAITAVIGFVQSIPDRFAEFFERARVGVEQRTNSLIGIISGLPGRILKALGNVGAMLFDAGARIIGGLISGISSRFDQLRDKIAEAVQNIRDHLPFSPAKVGPLSGAGSPEIAGATIAEMIAQGIQSKLGAISAAAAGAAGSASPLGDAGVAALLGTTTGATPSPMSPLSSGVVQQPVFIVQIGNEEIDAFIGKRVEERVAIETRRLLAGSRR